MKDISMIEPPLLRYGDGRRTIDPLRGLAELDCPPAEKPMIDRLVVVPFIPQDCDVCGQLPNLLEALAEGITGARYSRCAFNGFQKHLGVRMGVEDPVIYRDLSDARSQIDRLADKRGAGDFLLAISIPDEDYGCGDYQQLKIRCIERDIPSQFVTGPSLKSYNSSKPDEKGTFLWNMALGFFTKIGGTPWVLDSPMVDVSAFIGIATVASVDEGVLKRKGATALQIVNKWGRPVSTLFSSHEQALRKEGVFRDINPTELSNLVRKSTVDIREHVLSPQISSEEDLVVIHLSDRYSKEAYNSMVEALTEEGFHNHKLIHIQRRSTHRQFDPTQQKTNQAWPRAGEWGYIIPGEKAFFYTAGSWRYYSNTPPYVVDASDVAPIEVELLKSSNESDLDRMDLENIYCLTRLKYDSVDIPRIRLPITITLARRASQLVSCGLSRSVFPAQFLY